MINFKDYLVGFGLVIAVTLFLLQKIRSHLQKKKKREEEKIKRKNKRKKGKH